MATVGQTIDKEAKQLSNLAIDIDNFRRRYKIKDSDKTIFFVSPSLSVLQKFRFLLTSKSVIKELEEKYYRKPDYLSFDEYGTTVLWPVLLYINNIPSIEEFTVTEVIIPDLSAITEMSRYNDSVLDVLDLAVLNRPPVKTRLKTLYSTKFRPKREPTE